MGDRGRLRTQSNVSPCLHRILLLVGVLMRMTVRINSSPRPCPYKQARGMSFVCPVSLGRKQKLLLTCNRLGRQGNEVCLPKESGKKVKTAAHVIETKPCSFGPKPFNNSNRCCGQLLSRLVYGFDDG